MWVFLLSLPWRIPYRFLVYPTASPTSLRTHPCCFTCNQHNKSINWSAPVSLLNKACQSLHQCLSALDQCLLSCTINAYWALNEPLHSRVIRDCQTLDQRIITSSINAYWAAQSAPVSCLTSTYKPTYFCEVTNSYNSGEIPEQNPLAWGFTANKWQS